MQKSINIIIPVCNEKENIQPMVLAIVHVMQSYNDAWQITYVDDGSTDGSLQVVQSLVNTYPNIFYIGLSRNFGHQNALKAGFDSNTCDAVITMDGDLQHPPTLLPTLIDHWLKGNDIVYTIRKDHVELPMVKRKTSNMFYQLLNRLSDIELESGTADFRLMDKKVVDIAKEMQEADLFWRGLVKWFGFTQIGIEYEPLQRSFGKSKYTFKKMMQFALKGITSFSIKPLGIAIYLGFIFSLLSLLYIPYALIAYINGYALSGWTSIIVTIAFFGGLQLMILGIIGMYLGKLFMQSKQRPHYLVKDSNIVAVK
jgi:polyisoprenyl-phosphate glycosyltransferase